VSRRLLGWGLVLVGLYLVVTVATTRLQPGRVRPLFDGIAPPPGSYRWSPLTGADHPAPEGAATVVNLSPSGSDGARLNTPDGQASLGLFRNVATAEGAEVFLEISLDPRDPLLLGPPPAGLHPWSNAYEVRLTAQPGGRPIETLAIRGQLALVAGTAGGGARMLYSADGTSWEAVGSEPFGSGADQEAEITRAGIYLLAGPEQLLVESSSRSFWWKLVAGLIPALIIGLVVWLFQQRSYRRRRRRLTEGPPGPPA
jgi:hypothetical protein